MQAQTAAHDLPAAVWIALIVLGFVLFWPLGLMILFCFIWSGKMRCCSRRSAIWRSENLRRWCTSFNDSVSSGNIAFDEYRDATLRHLEEEQREFGQFVERLRRAKDQDEFDKFMSEQATRRDPA